MYLNKKVKDIVSKLSSDERLRDTKVIMAYPNVNKPTQLRRVVIAVSPSSLNAQNISIGDVCIYGEYSVDIDVFVPQNLGTPCIQDVVEKIIDIIKNESLSGIKVSQIKVNNSLFCHYVNCCMTFRGEIDFGGSAYD